MRGGSAATLLALTLTAAAVGGCTSVANLISDSPSSDKPASSVSAPAAPGAAGATAVDAAAPGTTPTTAMDEYNCPEVTVRPGTATLMVSTPKPAGAELTAMDLRYQGTLVRFSRECGVRPGFMTMKVGVHGRVITGPAGGPGTLDVPLRIAVVQEGPEPKTVVSKLARLSVNVAGEPAFADFTHVDQDVTFPLPRNAPDIANYVVYVGFDPGAAAPKPAAPARRRR
jgi:hypothetical protein